MHILYYNVYLKTKENETEILRNLNEFLCENLKKVLTWIIQRGDLILLI